MSINEGFLQYMNSYKKEGVLALDLLQKSRTDSSSLPINIWFRNGIGTSSIFCSYFDESNCPLKPNTCNCSDLFAPSSYLNLKKLCSENTSIKSLPSDKYNQIVTLTTTILKKEDEKLTEFVEGLKEKNEKVVSLCQKVAKKYINSGKNKESLNE